MTELSKEKKRRSRILWITGLGLCLLVIAIISGIAIRSYQRKRMYTRYIQEADEYYASKDYEKAIVSYKAALKLNDSHEHPYAGLGNSYIQESEYAMARIYLREGYEKTHSIELKVTLDEIEGLADGTSPESLEENVNEDSEWNDSLIGDLGHYTYQQYSDEYGTGNVRDTGSQYEVTIRELGAVAYYDKNTTGSDGSSGPGEGSIPSYLVFDDLTAVFYEWNEGLTPETVEKVIHEQPEIRQENKDYWLVFNYLDCKFSILCDGDGVVSSPTARNIVTPLGKPVAGDHGTVCGTLVNAKTGDPVEDVTIALSDSDSESGLASTGDDGFFTADVDTGDITLSFSKTGFITVTKNVFLTANATEDLGNIPISPNLGEGEWRIVLSWGDEPRDLDLHLKSDDMYLCYNTPGRKASGSDNESADLDIDATTGNGMETITIKNMRPGETYQFFVKDYTNKENPDSTALSTSGAEVNVYSPDEGLIWSGSVPGGPGTVWDVCTIVDGEVKEDGGMEGSRSDLD